MDELLPALAGTIDEHDFFLRRDAIAAGYDDSAIARERRSGRWRRIRYGAYTTAAIWDAANEDRRHVLTAAAVARATDDKCAFSHVTSVVLHGCPHWNLPLDRVHTTRVDGRGGGRNESGVRRHRSALDPAVDVATTAGLRHTSAARVIFEIGATAGTEAALCVGDDLLRRGRTSTDELEAYADRVRQWPGSLGVEVLLRLLDGRHESVAESRTGYLFVRHGIHGAVPQWHVNDAGQCLGRVDFAFPEAGVFVEFDGWIKYSTLRRPGETVEDVMRREKIRQETISAVTGWECIRITWADLAVPGRTAERIRKALERGRRRMAGVAGAA